MTAKIEIVVEDQSSSSPTSPVSGPSPRSEQPRTSPRPAGRQSAGADPPPVDPNVAETRSQLRTVAKQLADMTGMGGAFSSVEQLVRRLAPTLDRQQRTAPAASPAAVTDRQRDPAANRPDTRPTTPSPSPASGSDRVQQFVTNLGDAGERVRREFTERIASSAQTMADLPAHIRRGGVALSTVLATAAATSATALGSLTTAVMRQIGAEQARSSSQQQPSFLQRIVGGRQQETTSRRTEPRATTPRPPIVAPQRRPDSVVTSPQTAARADRRRPGQSDAVRLPTVSRPTTPPLPSVVQLPPTGPRSPSPSPVVSAPHSAAPQILPRANVPQTAVRPPTVGPVMAQAVPMSEQVLAGIARVGAVAGPAAIAIGAVTGAAWAVKSAFDAVSSAVRSNVDRLAEYSSTLSLAQARAELRDQRLGFHEARRISPELSRLSDTTSRMNDAIQRNMIEMKVALLRVLEPLLDHADTLSTVLETSAGYHQFQNELISSLKDFLVGDFAGSREHRDGMMEAVRRLIRLVRGDEEDLDSPFERMLDEIMTDHISGGGRSVVGGSSVPRRVGR